MVTFSWVAKIGRALTGVLWNIFEYFMKKFTFVLVIFIQLRRALMIWWLTFKLGNQMTITAACSQGFFKTWKFWGIAFWFPTLSNCCFMALRVNWEAFLVNEGYQHIMIHIITGCFRPGRFKSKVQSPKNFRFWKRFDSISLRNLFRGLSHRTLQAKWIIFSEVVGFQSGWTDYDN